MSNTNGQTAHLWAQQTRESGKSSNGNLSFEGEILYSYTTPIGRFVRAADGTRVTLVNSNRYSITTSGKHMPALWRAIGYGRGDFAPCFTVPHLWGGSGLGYRHHPLTEKEHAANLAHLVEQYVEEGKRFKRVRDLPHMRRVSDVLIEEAATARLYARLFGLAVPSLNPAAYATEIFAHRAKREAERNDPAAAEKRAKARAAAVEKRAKARAAAVEKWRSGETNALPPVDDGAALLRIRGDVLETSLGARVPLADAIRVFRLVKLCKARETQWTRNGHVLPVGHFNVNWIDAAGNFRAGCHTIRWDEVARAATAAGVFDIEPEDTSVAK